MKGWGGEGMEGEEFEKVQDGVSSIYVYKLQKVNIYNQAVNVGKKFSL